MCLVSSIANISAEQYDNVHVSSEMSMNDMNPWVDEHNGCKPRKEMHCVCSRWSLFVTPNRVPKRIGAVGIPGNPLNL